MVKRLEIHKKGITREAYKLVADGVDLTNLGVVSFNIDCTGDDYSTILEVKFRLGKIETVVEDPLKELKKRLIKKTKKGEPVTYPGDCPLCGGLNITSGDNWSCGDGYVRCSDCGCMVTADTEKEAKRKWYTRRQV